MSDVSYVEVELRAGTQQLFSDVSLGHYGLSRWMSVLQNSKEEALNNAFKGDDSTGENNIVQELTKEIISEVQKMTGNDVCCDCGAPGDRGPLSTPFRALRHPDFILSHRIHPLIFHFHFKHEIKCSSA
jgi:hypothetical protein